jgi:ribose-phosphate pyrophosphokinase
MMKPLVFAGSANPALAEEIAKRLGVRLGECTLRRFQNSEVKVEVLESVRGRDVYLVQPTSPPVDEHLIEFLFMADACRRAGATRITAVVPYLGYARQDRRARGREALGARLIADLIRTAGLDRVLAVDLHTPSIEGFFGVALEHISAVPILANAILPALQFDVVILAPDLGAVKLAERYAQVLQAPIAVVHKVRISDEEVQIGGIVNEVRGRSAVVVDDMVSTGGTIEAAVNAFIAQGGDRDVVVAASHGVLVGPAVDRLRGLSLKSFFTTDSVEVPGNLPLPIKVISLAPLLAEAIERLNKEQSMSDLICHL